MKEEIKERIEQICRCDIPEGYKKENGWIIPNNWSMRKGTNLFSFIRNGFVGTVTPYYCKDGIRYLQGTNIKNGKIVSEEVFFVTNEFHTKHPNSQLRTGDIVVIQSGAVGECAVINKEYNGGNCHALIIMSPHDKTNSLWFSNLLNSPYSSKLLRGIITGNTIKHILASDMKKLEIPTPSVTEQKKIANILTTQDRVIELKENCLVEKQRQKKYLMQQLLTGKRRVSGFGGEWKIDRLGKLFLERKETNCEGLEMLAITGTQGIIPRKELDLKDNSSEDKSKYLKVCVGDIGYNTMRMWQGVSAYSNYEGIVSPAYTILKQSSSINAKYFAYLFKMPEIIFLFYRYSQGLVDDTRNLKYENFKKIRVFYPSDVKEQTAIAKVLSTADREIDLLRQDIEQEKKKKKALMQLLLTGIVRVKI